MKRKLKLILSALVIITTAGCTDESEVPGKLTPDGKTVTFTLQGTGKGATTYAVPVVADEDRIDHLDIYMFDQDTKLLENVYHHQDIIFGTAGTNKTATVDVTERTGSKLFYLVANAENLSSELDVARFGETTYEEFREGLSDVQDNLPAIPLMMSGTTSIDDITQPTADELKLKVYRRMARFDVKNDAADTEFTINNIIVTGASKQTYIFRDATENPARIVEAAQLGIIPFDTRSDANLGESPGVFYMFGTILGDGKAEIAFEGKFNGATRLFSFKPQADFTVEPNKRYTLTAKKIDINNIEFELTVEEWDDGGSVTAEPGENALAISDLTLVKGDGVLAGRAIDDITTYNVTNATQESVLRFTVSANRKDAALVTVKYETALGEQRLPVTISATPAEITYGIRYEQSFEVTIPTSSTYLPVVATVEVTNAFDQIQVKTFKITREAMNYEGTPYKPVLLGGIWWAPVNVGATTINGTDSPEDMGYLFQWGRDYGALSGTMDDIVQGPMSLAEASLPENANKFITATTATLDWLDPRQHDLWTGSNSRGPCPEGWRIPAKDDFQLLVDAYSTNEGKPDLANFRMELKGDDPSTTLYLPFAGYRGTSGIAQNFAIRCVYWSSDYESSIPDEARNTYYLSFYNTNDIPYIAMALRAEALSVRCVADN